jgi:hypothetical protein
MDAGPAAEQDVVPPVPTRAAPPPPVASYLPPVPSRSAAPAAPAGYRNPFAEEEEEEEEPAPAPQPSMAAPPSSSSTRQIPSSPSGGANGAPVSMAGWLHKKGAIVKSYKKRWMILKGNELQWYESERQPTPQGTLILLPTERTVVDTPGDVKFEIHHKDPKERIYFLKAESPSDKKRWLSVLQALLEPGQQQQQQLSPRGTGIPSYPSSSSIPAYVAPSIPAYVPPPSASEDTMVLPPVPTRAAPPPPVTATPFDDVPPMPEAQAGLGSDDGMDYHQPPSYEQQPYHDDQQQQQHSDNAAAANNAHSDQHVQQRNHPVSLTDEHYKLAATLGSLGGLGLGDDDDGGYDDHGAPPIPSYHLPTASKLVFGPPSAAEAKRAQDLTTIDWFEERVNTPNRAFARSAYEQDSGSLAYIQWNTLSGDERDTWRLLVLTQMLSDKEQVSAELAVLRTLWLPAFGLGTKSKAKIKKLVNEPLFSALEEQTLEMFDRHRNLALQLAQSRNAFYETRSFGELVLKMANQAAKIDCAFVEAFPEYVVAYQYHLEQNAKFAKYGWLCCWWLLLVGWLVVVVFVVGCCVCVSVLVCLVVFDV